MNRQQILARLRKVLGPGAFYRISPKAPGADERREAGAIYRDAVTKADLAQRAMEMRREELLLDPEYVRLCAEYEAIIAVRDAAQHKMLCCPIVVGAGGVAAVHGDTWPEVFAKLDLLRTSRLTSRLSRVTK